MKATRAATDSAGKYSAANNSSLSVLSFHRTNNCLPSPSAYTTDKDVVSCRRQAMATPRFACSFSKLLDDQIQLSLSLSNCLSSLSWVSINIIMSMLFLSQMLINIVCLSVVAPLILSEMMLYLGVAVMRG